MGRFENGRIVLTGRIFDAYRRDNLEGAVWFRRMDLKSDPPISDLDASGTSGSSLQSSRAIPLMAYSANFRLRAPVAPVASVPGEAVFRDDSAVDEMFLNDPLQHLGRARVVPDAFGINDRDRAARADSKTIHLAAIHQRLRADQIQFLEAPFQKFPRLDPFFLLATIRLGLIRTEKDVAPISLQAQGGRRPLQRRVVDIHSERQC